MAEGLSQFPERRIGARALRPLILKSPTHGFRVATLRELLPDARFVLIVRDPATHFESVIRMWAPDV